MLTREKMTTKSMIIISLINFKNTHHIIVRLSGGTFTQRGFSFLVLTVLYHSIISLVIKLLMIVV